MLKERLQSGCWKCLIFTYFLLHCFGKGREVSQILQQIKNITYIAGNESVEPSLESPILCLLLCKMSDGCNMVAYDSVQRSCRQASWKKTEVVPGTQDQGIFVVKDLPTIHIKGILTYEDSKSACENIGGNLTTIGQMTEVWNTSYSHCSCGWISEGSAVFPSHNESSENCGGMNMVTTCENKTTSNAWCTVNLK